MVLMLKGIWKVNKLVRTRVAPYLPYPTLQFSEEWVRGKTLMACLTPFVDDTRIYSNIAESDDCDNLQYDLNSIYNWNVHNNILF